MFYLHEILMHVVSITILFQRLHLSKLSIWQSGRLFVFCVLVKHCAKLSFSFTFLSALKISHLSYDNS